jgi:preprotein translocase SecF subunit
VRLDPRGVDVDDPDASNRWQIRHPLNDRDAGDRFVKHIETALDGKLLPVGFTDFEALPAGDDLVKATITLRALATPEGVDAETMATAMRDFKLEGKPAPLSDVTVVGGDEADTYVVSTTIPDTGESELFVRDNVRLALQRMDVPMFLSDPMPSVSFLSPSRAVELWRTAMQAVLVAMLLQIVYIRLRFADFKHGFAAACALIHDVTIALGFVAVFDSTELVHAKINLVLIAAFLTLIGYSMNDTIVVFDRIRENLGKSKVVRTRIVNEAVNQTLSRSIRTSITTWIVVMIQFVLNYGSGSVLEGFAFVMVIGVISGTYSSIFIAGPLLLFLPDYWRKLSAKRGVFWTQLLATVVGALVGIAAPGHGAQMWVGVALAANIPIHFFMHFIPWLGLSDPDSLLEEEIQVEEKERPLHKPGI